MRATTTALKQYVLITAFVFDSNITHIFKAYNVCKERDLVTEMVFLLGRMGNNKKALTLIIERLGDVNRVCINYIRIVTCN